jgi:serine/threonine protein kinase
LLLDRISVGGMAEVFKAKSYGVEGFEKIIAIKRILPTMGEDRDFIKMFIDEAKIAGQLAHANICQIFELGRIDGSHFIAMEYIWGKDLLQIQNRVRKVKQHIPVPLACFAIAKVLEGLDYAHRKRDPLGRPLEIVHRDCSPQNVLVSYEGEVKVIDFGIAKATSRNSRTMAGVLKGKFGYMSPEQVRGLPLDRRSDIFALGTMLYECLTGERLFQGETDFSTLEKVRNVDIQAPRAVNPEIPEAVEKVLLKALAKDVDDRYQWCSEMLADLQQYLMSQDVVFTAKSLSSWLKEMFSQEIDRERQQLEQYKRVGRDGLIAGVPAAEAKLDVVEALGEAGAPEGDATMLGAPSFEEMEEGIGAAPDVSQSPATTPPVNVSAMPAPSPEEDEEEFGEEAPTEIFGDDPAAAIATTPPLAAGAARTSTPSLHQVLTKAPPRPPPGRTTPQRLDSDAVAVQPMYPTAEQPAVAPPYGGAPSYAPPPPMGTPNVLNVPQPGAGPSKTMLGVQAPTVLGNYGQPLPRPSGPMEPPYGGWQPPPGYSQSPPWNTPPPQQPYTGDTGWQPPQYGYNTSQPSGAVPVDQQPLPQMVELKRSTLSRDIGIGVAIAALVLLTFLGVKKFVLDKADSPSTPSSMATVKLKMKGGPGRMFIDDVASNFVNDGDEVPVSPGKHHIKIVGPVNACDTTVLQLDGGKTTTLDCVLAAPSTGSADPATGSAADPATGSAMGGSDTAMPPESKAPDTKPVEPGDTKGSAATAPADVKGAAATTPGDVQTVKSSTVIKPDKPDKSDKSDVKTTTTAPRNDTKTTSPKPDTKATKTDAAKQSDTKSDTSKTEAPADASKGYLQVFSRPTAKILVDGAETGMRTPVSGHMLSLPAGRHKVTFVIGDDRFTYPVTIEKGATASMTKDLQ